MTKSKLICDNEGCNFEMEDHLAIKICYSDEFYLYCSRDCALRDITVRELFLSKEDLES